MSLAKKSIKWFVALVVVFALVLTASVALGRGVTSASAEPATPQLFLKAVADGEGTDAMYPHLIEGSDHTLVVRYYMSAPSGFESSETVALAAKLFPQIVSGNVAYTPDSIEANPNLSLYVNTEMYKYVITAEDIEEDPDLEGREGEFLSETVILDGTALLSNLLANGAYLFEATYTIPDDAAIGEYVYALADGCSFSIGHEGYTASRVDYDLAMSEASDVFYVRKLVQIPEAEDCEFSGEAQSGNLETTDDYTVSGTGITVNAQNDPYVTTLTLEEYRIWDLGENVEGRYSISAQNLTWNITPKAASVVFANDEYDSEYGQTTANSVNSIFAEAGEISATGDVEGYRITGFGWELVDSTYENAIDLGNYATPAEYLAAANVGTYYLRATYTPNANYTVTAGHATYEITIVTTEIDITATPSNREYTGQRVTIGTVDEEIIYSCNVPVEVTITWYALVSNEWTQTGTGAGNGPVSATPGSYKVVVSYAGSQNYTSASDEAEFTIAKADQDITITATDRYFNGSAVTVADLTISTTSDQSLLDTATVTNTVLHAGVDQTVNVYIEGNNNYKPYPGSTTITINPIPVTYAVTFEETYNGSAFTTPTVTAVSFTSTDALTAFTTVADLNAAATDFTYSFTIDANAPVKNAGSYSSIPVTITALSYGVANKGDFIDAGTCYASGTVNKANLELSFDKTSDTVSFGTTVTEGYDAATTKHFSYRGVIAGESWDVSAKRFDAAASLTHKFYNDSACTQEVTPTAVGEYWLKVTLDSATTNFNANTTGITAAFSIVPTQVPVYLSYVYEQEDPKYVVATYSEQTEDYTLEIVTDATASQLWAGMPFPAAGTLKYFHTTGFGAGNVPYSGDPQYVSATYTFDVGAGDANGDKVVNVEDFITIRKILANHIAVKDKPLITAAQAWASYTDSNAALIFKAGVDIVENNKVDAADALVVLEAFVTGYGYAIMEGVDVSGQSIVALAEEEVETYDELVAAIKRGHSAKLIADISAATRDFAPVVPILNGSIHIDMNGHTLNVNTFVFASDKANVTLEVYSNALDDGIIFSTADITISAPNGNVKVANINGYTYEGSTVTLAAYSGSLHIEKDVAFYLYHYNDPTTGDKLTLDEFSGRITEDNDVDDIAEERIAATETRVKAEAAVAVLEADPTNATALSDLLAALSEEDQATYQNATAQEIFNELPVEDIINVKKAPVSVPVDTHVVVEEDANLKVKQVNVVAAASTYEANEEVSTTFSIEVQNAEADDIKVDISEVKDGSTPEVVYHVESVALAGDTSKVSVVKAENQTYTEKTYVAQNGTNFYETLQAAINAAANGDTIKLITNVEEGSGLEIKDGTVKNVTIDFNGKTYTMYTGSVGSTGTETQAMHWSTGSTVTLKNGTFVVSEHAATVDGANGKRVKMAMQNYSTLTVKNMTMDFSEIVVQNYKNYAVEGPQQYAKYSLLEIPLFNLNAGSLTIEEGSTITMPNDSTAGIYIEEVDSCTIKNSTINGYVALSSDHTLPNVTIINSTASGVVSYFAGYGVKHSGNVYRLGGVSVTNATELQAALSAGAIIIDIENDFNAPNPIAVSKSTIINGYDHTITSNGNRIMNVTEPDLVITINDLTMTSATSERGLNIWDSATGSDITLNNVYIDAHLYAINYVNGADDATLVVNDSYLKGWGAINAHFNDSSVVVNNSTLYGINRTSDHTYGFNTITIDGDSLHGAQEGEHGVNNTFVFDGCTIIAEVRDTHQDWISFQYAATGNTATVVVNNCEILDAPNGNDKTYAMSIQGTNNAVVMALSAEQYAIVAAKHFNITDNGNGTYTIMPKTANISYFGTPYNFYDVFENGWLEDTEAFTLTDDVVLDVDVVFAENRAAAIAVSGGTFEMNLDGCTISGEGKILLPVGVTCVTDSDVSIAGIFEVPEGEVLIESVDADGNYIYAVGVAYVKTKAEFTAAITAGAKKLVICADINLSMYTYNRDMDITIDLNGHTLTTTMTGITFSAARTLNIVDSSANGTGAINSTGNYAINMGTSSTADTVINVYGGTLTGKTSAAVKVNDGTLNVYGGTLTCPAADKYAILNYQGYAGTVNIIDGTFTAAVAVANNGTGEVNIYGGTFSADPSDFVASGYMAVEDEGTWTVVEAEITITTFAELKAAIADVNAGNIVYPTLIIANDIQFEEELTISKSVYIMGDGEVKFIGYDASTKYDEAFYINVADEDQEITIDGIIFDHFCYYSNVANKTKATSSAVKNGVAYITYGGDCPASTTLYVTGCQFLGTARDMINASSTKGCKGFIVIEDCYFDATDRLSSTLNMLSFYGNADAELSVIITGCTFKEASEQNATWATSAIASFGNADITVAECEFIACQIGIAIDNTFDRLYSTSTYPVYYNTTVTYSDLTFTNCYFGYFGEFFVEDASEIPEEAELYTDEPFTHGDAEATQFHFAAEYDVYEAGDEGEAQHRIYLCYYVKA